MTSAWAGTPSGAGPFHSTAMSGESSVSCSGTVTVSMAVDRRPPGAAGDELGRPAQHLFEKRPGVVKLQKPVVLAARLRVEAKRLRGFLGVERRLADGRQPFLAQHVRADHQPLGLEIVEPFRRFVLTRVIGHGSCLSSSPARDRRGR